VTDAVVMEVLRDALLVGAKLSAPVLLTALVVGFAISLVQSVTQMQEMTISFVPKAVAVGVALVVSGRWMMLTITEFTTELYTSIPELVRIG
jgi:flagellar biosynthesis protein FliQ